MKKMITKDDWRMVFKNKQEMMEYDIEIAEQEFEIEIRKEPNIWKVANRISFKKWMAIANRNFLYDKHNRCGYCFAMRKLNIHCIDCLMEKGFGENNCWVDSSVWMIKRFQNPKLLKLIKEAGKKK